MRELLSVSDVALELVDSRNPIATRSKKLERVAEKLGVPILVVINKADLIPRKVAEAWKEWFEEQGLRAVYIAAQRRMGTRVLRKAIKDVAGRGQITVSVFGVPKVGKSTLINILKGRHSARTSPYPGSPGYTTHAQVYKIGGGIYLIDSPGILPPESGGVEAIIRSAPVDNIKNVIQVALELMKIILQHNPYAFLEAYGIESRDLDGILRELARMRGWVYKRDKEPIIEEAAKAIIRDYLAGKINYFFMPPRPEGSLGRRA